MSGENEKEKDEIIIAGSYSKTLGPNKTYMRRFSHESFYEKCDSFARLLHHEQIKHSGEPGYLSLKL